MEVCAWQEVEADEALLWEEAMAAGRERSAEARERYRQQREVPTLAAIAPQNLLPVMTPTIAAHSSACYQGLAAPIRRHVQPARQVASMKRVQACIHAAVQEEMLQEAEAMVAARRGPEIAVLRTEPGRDRVFAWAGGPPRAGATAVLAYNKACGALRRGCGMPSPHARTLCAVQSWSQPSP